MKVAEPSQTLAEDVARVRAAREYLGPDGRVRVDANGGWTMDEAERAVHTLAEFDPAGLLGEGRKHRPRLEVRAIPITGQREEVVPVEENVDAEILEFGRGLPNVGIAGVLWCELHADANGSDSAHPSSLWVGQGTDL